MAARPRDKKRRDLPRNLRERDGYFSWYNPLTRKEVAMGRIPRAQAVNEAIEANAWVQGQQGQARLVDHLKGTAGQTFKALRERFEKALARRPDVGEQTRKDYRRRLEVVGAQWDDRLAASITTGDVAELLDGYIDAGKLRMAQAQRSLLDQAFNEAIRAGWCSSNPVTPTVVGGITVRRARLTLEQFRQIHAYATARMAPRVARAMELALVTGQRLGDIADMRFDQAHDGKLWIVQGKTDAHECLDLSIYLPALDATIGDVISRCRDAILSRHLIHHDSHAGRAKPGDPVRDKTISLEFAAARDESGVIVPAGKTPPTFHEIRSLSARLYAEAYDEKFAQLLLGHKSADMTAVYRDVRGAEWVDVSAPPRKIG